MAQRRRRTTGMVLGGWMMGGIAMLALAAGGVWLVAQVFGPRQTGQRHAPERQVDGIWFDYAVSVEPDRLRISGTADVPNGVILVGTLDKIGLGPLEIKEAFVLNRTFTMEFGPALSVQDPWLGPITALTAGAYRISVDFDPNRQSPFVRTSLARGSVNSTGPTGKDAVREGDPALVRVAKTFTIGTPQEQQEAQIQEQQYRQMLRQRLDEMMGELTVLWQRLRTQYLQESKQGGFPRTDPRASAWQTWSAQWLSELRALEEKYRLREATSSAVPYGFVREALTAMHRQMSVIKDLYFEVLVNERSPNDQELQRAEQQLLSAYGDALAQLSRPDEPRPAGKPESVRSTVIITSPLVNIRRGPGTSYEAFRQIKKDEVLDWLREQGEWLQVKLPDGRVGWVHRSVASKSPAALGATDEAKHGDGKLAASERRTMLKLEPVMLQALPVAYLPRPTPDEFKIYAEIEQQLRDLAPGSAVERQIAEQRILQRSSEKYGVSQALLWNVYLKVQGWEIRPEREGDPHP
jgi:hypothetical protein